jgi:hypothetical protein
LVVLSSALISSELKILTVKRTCESISVPTTNVILRACNDLRKDHDNSILFSNFQVTTVEDVIRTHIFSVRRQLKMVLVCKCKIIITLILQTITKMTTQAHLPVPHP